MNGKKQNSWQVLYTRYDGIEKRAVEFVSREAGKYLIRDGKAYSIYVLPVNEASGSKDQISQNAIVIGLYDESPLIRELLKNVKPEMQEDGYYVEVAVSPNDPSNRVVVITANQAIGLLHGAVAFVDEYPVFGAPMHGGNLRYPDLVFDEEMPPFSLTGAPKTKTRGIFSWGQPINDYRAYIKDMARLKLNQLILWNDFLPVNAREIIEYAHGFGIEVIWGYAWGWNTKIGEIKSLDDGFLKEIKESAIKNYRENYAPLGVDGIYFQSFTEIDAPTLGGRCIAEAVVEMVNDTVHDLLESYPDLHIQFGLHARSVKDRLEYIAKTDERVEIVWEDCGAFPSGYLPETAEADFDETMKLFEKIIDLRKGARDSFILKGFMVLDWNADRFVHQAGPYIMGENSAEISENDRAIRKRAWRLFSAEWLKYGEYALKAIRFINEKTGGNVNVSMAGTFDGGIYLPEALCAEMIYDPSREFGDILKDCVVKDYVELC